MFCYHEIIKYSFKRKVNKNEIYDPSFGITVWNARWMNALPVASMNS